MKRLPRIILTTLTLVSIPLFLASAILWARSYREPDQLRWGHADKSYWQFDLRPGLVTVSCIHRYWTNTRSKWIISTLHVPHPPRAGKYVALQRFDNDQHFIWSPSSYRGWHSLSLEQGTCAEWKFASPVMMLQTSPSVPYSSLVVPCWLIAFITLILPLYRLSFMLNPRRAHAPRQA